MTTISLVDQPKADSVAKTKSVGGQADGKSDSPSDAQSVFGQGGGGKLTPKQAEYLGISVHGPFKPEYYRY